MAAALAAGGMAPAAAAPGADANTATQAELETIKGIGPELSERILDERRRRPYADWADFGRRVPGVGPRNAARLSAAGLSVGGRSFPGVRPSASAPGSRN